MEELISLIPYTLSTEDRALIDLAYNYARTKHHNQVRNSGEPYVTHAVAVAKNCAKLGADIPTIIGALIHDTLEDTDATEDEIREQFGEEILFLVRGVTKLGHLKYPGTERHVESMRRFFIALAEDIRVLIIKLADRLHNIETLDHVPPDKQHRIAVETIQIYAPLAGRLGMGKLKGLLEDLAFPFAYPDEQQKTQAVIDRLVPHTQELMSQVQQELRELLESFGVQGTVEARVKHNYSLYKKLVKYAWDEDKIHDIVALRVIVDTTEACYQTLGLIHSLWKPVAHRIQDWIALPKPNGYRSLHTTVLTNQGPAEIQIRTHEMHSNAEFGLASHLIYKEQKVGSGLSTKEQFTWLQQLKELSGLVQDSREFAELTLDFFTDRIFVLTPKGDVVDLPEGATPIDFAYAIHSDIGDHIQSASINKKMVGIDTLLKNGDVVTIATHKNAHPTAKWLEHTKTTLAKRKIRAALEDSI